MIAGRAATLIVLGVVAAGQLALAGILDGVTLAHLSTPTSSFGDVRPGRAVGEGERPDIAALHLRQPAAVPRR